MQRKEKGALEKFAQRTAVLTITSTLAALTAGSTLAATVVCPALKSNGDRLSTPPAAKGFDLRPDLSDLPDTTMSESLANQARDIVAVYETGQKSGFGHLSALDDLSVGISQWNVGKKSFYDTLLANIPLATFELADSAVRTDLITMKTQPAKRSAIFQSWQTETSTDKLGPAKVRQSVAKSLSAWLSTDAVSKVNFRLLKVTSNGHGNMP